MGWTNGCQSGLSVSNLEVLLVVVDQAWIAVSGRCRLIGVGVG